MRSLSLALIAALVLASCVDQPLDRAEQGAALSGEAQNLTPNTCIGVGAAIRVTNGGWRGCDLGKEIESFRCGYKKGVSQSTYIDIYRTHKGVLIFEDSEARQITAVQQSRTSSGTRYTAKGFLLLVTGDSATVTRSGKKLSCTRSFG